MSPREIVAPAYVVVRGRGRVDVFADGVQVAQAAVMAGGCYFAVRSSAGRWIGHDWERITLEDFARRWHDVA